ncbi:MAG: aminoacyltransferase [Lactobacillaceae bacterium]|jgi:alanine adding enzyme|nr:aminoacyltransferase [Lactobacillaceae bacterium]
MEDEYKLIEVEHKEQVQDFFDKNPNSMFLQSYEQFQLLKMRGGKVHFLALASENEVVGTIVMTEAKTRLFGPVFIAERGPVFKNLKSLKLLTIEIKKFAAERQVFSLRIRPNFIRFIRNENGEILETENTRLISALKKIGYKEHPARPGYENATGFPLYQYTKNLSKLNNEKELFDSFGKDAKYYIRKNQQFGITVRLIKREELSLFKKITQMSADRIGFSDKDLEYYQDVYDVFKDDAEFLVAEINFKDYIGSLNKDIKDATAKVEKLKDKPKASRQINDLQEFTINKNIERIKQAEKFIEEDGQTVTLAVGLFVFQGSEVDYLFSGTNDKYKNFYGPYEIQYEVMQRAIEKGFSKYNFLGISGIFDGSDGVLDFKLGFNGQAEEMLGEFEIPTVKSTYYKYQIYRRLMKIRYGIKNILKGKTHE